MSTETKALFEQWCVLEEWRPVIGFDGLYDVSNLGKIKRVGRAAVRGKGQGGGILLQVGDPTSLEWWAEGRAATRAEVEHSVVTGIGTLEAMATAESPAAIADLARRRAWLEMQYPVA